MSELLGTGMTLAIRFLKPVGIRVGIEVQKGAAVARLYVRPAAQGEWRDVELPGPGGGDSAACWRCRCRSARLGVKTPEPVAFFVVLTREALGDRAPPAAPAD